jgi:hypothetical protein
VPILIAIASVPKIPQLVLDSKVRLSIIALMLPLFNASVRVDKALKSGLLDAHSMKKARMVRDVLLLLVRLGVCLIAFLPLSLQFL